MHVPRRATACALAGLWAVATGLPAHADGPVRPAHAVSLVTGYVQSIGGLPMFGVEYAWRALPQSELLVQAMSSLWMSNANVQFRHCLWHGGSAGLYVSAGPQMAVALASPGFGAGLEVGGEYWFGGDWRLAGGIGGIAEVLPGWALRPTVQVRFGKAW